MTGMPLAQLISAAQLQQRLAEPDLLILDCRFALEDLTYGQRSYAEGHIPGAQFADLERDLSGPIHKGITGRHPLPEPAQLLQRLRECGLGGCWPGWVNVTVCTCSTAASRPGAKPVGH